MVVWVPVSWLLVVLRLKQSSPLAWGGLCAGLPKGRAFSQMSDSPPSLLSQAREELRPVKEDFEAKNKQLLEEMPKFYSSRIDYFKPSFESLVRAQVRCCPPSIRHCQESLWWASSLQSIQGPTWV